MAIVAIVITTAIFAIAIVAIVIPQSRMLVSPGKAKVCNFEVASLSIQQKVLRFQVPGHVWFLFNLGLEVLVEISWDVD